MFKNAMDSLKDMLSKGESDKPGIDESGIAAHIPAQIESMKKMLREGGMQSFSAHDVTVALRNANLWAEHDEVRPIVHDLLADDDSLVAVANGTFVQYQLPADLMTDADMAPLTTDDFMQPPNMQSPNID